MTTAKNPSETTALWTPSAARIADSKITQFQQDIEQRFSIHFDNYQQLHQWSIDHPEKFWQQVWDFCGIQSSKKYHCVMRPAETFSETKWFEGATFNFAENLLRYRDDNTALVSLLENGKRTTFTYRELFKAVEQLAAALRAQGVVCGDRVAGFLPNIAESVIAMLATTSIGAIWSSCSPDFGIDGVCDRFDQIQPKVLFSADGYYYNGKTIDCLDRLKTITARISSLEKVIVIPLTKEKPDLSGLDHTEDYHELLNNSPDQPLVFEQLPFDHPLYIMYSSGTTGVPKCIVHSAGGTLIQHLKELQLHTNVTRQDTLFYYTTCGWMMWNWLVSGLACGANVVLYDGSPFANKGRLLLDSIDQEGISIFGTSAKFISALQKIGIKPAETHQLKTLNTILSTGSPLSHESYEYIYQHIKTDLCVSSICGGTDIISCFILGNPTLPVYSGEIQCRGLGMAVEIWNEQGQTVTEEKGELVCTRPFPSAPLGFWNDPDNTRFHAAYFSQFDNIWCQGDIGQITHQQGVIIYGRSDTVLNPGGVRIGTAEIYRQVEKLNEVIDSAVVGQQWQDDVRVILFVVLQDHISLSEALITTIKNTIRAATTPRHVPSKVISVTDIPKTISGKTAELAIKNIINDQPVNNTGALANPESLDYFKNLDTLTE